MSANDQKNNILELDSNEANKNEEDLLAFSSKYKSTMLKDEDIKEKETDFQAKRRKLSQDSTSISLSQEYNNLSGMSKKINVVIKDELFDNNESKNIFQDRQRKMSSPLYCYYDGSDKYLSKTQKTIIDIKNSQNYIKKENFFNNSYNSSKNIKRFNKKNSLNNEFINNNLNYNFNFPNNNCSLSNEDNINDFGQKTKRLLSFNGNQINFDYNYNSIPQQNSNNFLYFNNNNNYQQQLYNLNYYNLSNLRNNNVNNSRKLSFNFEEGIIGNFFNNILQSNYHPILFTYNEGQEDNLQVNNNSNSSNKSIPNVKKHKAKKPFDKRKGDWLCPDCHNLNFAFRVICNRCQKSKPSETIDNNEQ